ncbi:MAG TPA: alpha-amylase family glycosyl hydrolase, partial [Trueperaceae bacterium]
DGAMNYYGFAMPVRAFLASVDHRRQRVCVDAEDFARMLARARAPQPFDDQLSQFNLLGSHDTARFLSVAGDRSLVKLAVTLLFTYVGVPCVYYGDEVGLAGEEDPDCRRAFPWDEAAWDRDLLVHYRRLIALRRSSMALQQGAFIELHARRDVYAFARQLAGETVVVVVNRGNATRVELPVWKAGLWSEVLRPLVGDEPHGLRQGVLELDLPARAGAVFCVREPG